MQGTCFAVLNFDDFITETAIREGQPGRAAGALIRLADEMLPGALFTLSGSDGGQRVTRVASNQPEVLPVAQSTSIKPGSIEKTVWEEKLPLLLATPSELSRIAPLSILDSHGWWTGYGLPLVVGGAVYGSIGLMFRNGEYNESVPERAMKLILPSLAMLQLWQLCKRAPRWTNSKN